jgi:hypothetical protein
MAKSISIVGFSLRINYILPYNLLDIVLMPRILTPSLSMLHSQILSRASISISLYLDLILSTCTDFELDV